MTVQAGTIKAVNLIREPFGGVTGRHAAEIFVTLPSYTASSDTWSTAAVGAAIAAIRRDGRSITLKDVTQGQAGLDTSGTAMFPGTLAVSTDAITGEVHNSAGTEIDSAASATPLSFIVSYLLA